MLQSLPGWGQGWHTSEELRCVAERLGACSPLVAVEGAPAAAHAHADTRVRRAHPGIFWGRQVVGRSCSPEPPEEARFRCLDRRAMCHRTGWAVPPLVEKKPGGVFVQLSACVSPVALA